MNISETTQEIKTEKQIQQAHYTPEDIQQLIKSDMKQKGFNPGQVSLVASYGVVRDEWGFSSGTRGYFKEAIVEILN